MKIKTLPLWPKLFTCLLIAFCCLGATRVFSQDNIFTKKCYADKDGDGFGDPNDFITISTSFECIDNGRRADNGLDCNDNDASINPNTSWYKDFDKDGWAAPVDPIIQCTRPGDGYKKISELTRVIETNCSIVTELGFIINCWNDCDDQDPDVNDPLQIWYKDFDGDGYTDGNSFKGCDGKLQGFTTANKLQRSSNADGTITFIIDCNDNDATVIGKIWYKDEDGDGFWGGSTLSQCTQPPGYRDKSQLILIDFLSGGLSQDCDDNDPTAAPNIKWIEDADGDGYGSERTTFQCLRPGSTWFKARELKPGTDCDDGNAFIKPDNKWVLDKDWDGYYPGTEVKQCTSPGEGYIIWTTEIAGDCNDDDASINPDTKWVLDKDTDGYYAGTEVKQCTSPGEGYVIWSNQVAGDCDDGNASINPDTQWVLDKDTDGYYAGNGVKQCASPGEGYVILTNQIRRDCDDNNAEIKGATFWLLDMDGDGYTNPFIIVLQSSCLPPQDGNNYIRNSKGADCDDNDPTYNPETIWVKDADGDGYYVGEPYTGCFDIVEPGYVRKTNQQPGDCRDDNDKINPAAAEICDGIDNDCDGLTDEGFTDTDSDGVADCTDPDDDNDGIPDADDCAPLDAANTPLILNCPQDISINNCNTDAVETITTLAYNTTGGSITEQQLMDAKGSITPGACAVATISYIDAEDAASTDIKKIIKRTFTVTDIKGRAFTCTQTITLEDKTAPTVVTQHITVQLDNKGEAAISDNAVNNGSSDNCTAAANLRFSTDIKTFSCANIGTPVTVTLTVTDESGNSASKTATVTVVDPIKPEILSITPNPAVLFPPNRTMQPVTVSTVSNDGCGTTTCKIIAVTSNEPIEGTGGGDISPDWLITGDNTVSLRAERGTANTQRIYTITVECKDPSGNSTTGETQVTVGNGSAVVGGGNGGGKPKSAITISESALEIRVANNPASSATPFRLQVVSGNSENINLRLTDASGRVVESYRNIAPGTTLETGSGWTKGLYVAEALQGKKRVVVKLLKL